MCEGEEKLPYDEFCAMTERIDKPLAVLRQRCPHMPGERCDCPNKDAALVQARKDYERVIYIAEHLFEMVPQSAWRESGAEAFGMYEGDYWAEQIREELEFHRRQLPTPPPPKPKVDKPPATEPRGI